MQAALLTCDAIVCRFMSFLRPGGRLLISDYCCAEGPLSKGFSTYIKQRGCVSSVLCLRCCPLSCRGVPGDLPGQAWLCKQSSLFSAQQHWPAAQVD